MTSKLRAILAAVVSFLLLRAGCQPITDDVAISMAMETMYTVDALHPFPRFSHISDFMMEFASMHSIDVSAPYWDIDITLEDLTGESMKGFVAMEYALFSAEEGDASGLSDDDFFDFCSHRHDYETAADTKSRVQFIDWEFVAVDGPHAAASPMYLHLNATHPVHDSGLWMSIVHLCVTEGDEMEDAIRWSPWMHSERITMKGHQSAVNPLGLLGGDMLLAFPCLMAAGVVYVAVFAVYVQRMILYRESIIRSVHWTLLVGLVLVIADTVWEYFGIWRINTFGYDEPSLAMMIWNQCITHILTLYTRTAVLIISTGTGIVRPNLGKSMIRFLVIYGVVYCVVHSRIEWLEFELFVSRWARGPSGFEVQCIRHLLLILDFGFVAVSYFNFVVAITTLEQRKQHYKLGLLQRLMFAALLTVSSSLLLTMLSNWSTYNLDFVDPASWALMYMLNDGMWIGRQMAVVTVVVCLLRPHAESSRMAYSTEIPTTDTEDTGTPGPQSTLDSETPAPAAGMTEETQEDRAWEEMIGALQATGRRIKARVAGSNAADDSLG